MSRPAELSRNLAATRNRIAAACAAAGRDPAEITLVAVTKTYPASDVLALAGLGLTDFGENRDQEAAPKAAEVAAAGQPVTWHFIGQLQTNKAHSVAGYAELRALGGPDPAGAARSARRPAPPAANDLLVQVSLDPAVCRPHAVSLDARRRTAAACRRRCSPRSRRRSRPRKGSRSAG